MKSLSWAIAALSILATSSVFAQSEPGKSQQSTLQAEKLYSLDVEDEPVRKVLQNLFNSAGHKYELNEWVTGFVTVKVKDAPFETVLKAIMRTAYTRLTYSKEDGVYVVFLLYFRYPQKEGEKGYMPVQDLDLHLAPLYETVEKLLTEAKWKFVIDSEVKGTVTLRLRKVTLPTAVTEILCASGSEYAWRLDKKDSTLYVYPKRHTK